MQSKICDEGLDLAVILLIRQARMAKSIHRLSKVSPGRAIPDPSTPCRRATPETAPKWPFLG
jgi:hypothetical protein